MLGLHLLITTPTFHTEVIAKPNPYQKGAGFAQYFQLFRGTF